MVVVVWERGGGGDLAVIGDEIKCVSTNKSVKCV